MPAAALPDRLCLVDGSGIVFRAFHALPALTTRRGIPTGAVYGFTTMLTKLARESRARLVAVVFDAPGRTFRDEIYEHYKATRTATPPDLLRQLPYLKKMVEALGFPILEVSGVEADDVIGTLTERAVQGGLEVEIVTSDKDMMQLVSPRVRLIDTMNDRMTGVTEVRERFGVPPEQVVEVMGLMGDSIDNIPGVKGIGEKTAKTLIGHFGSVAETYRRLDEIASLGIRGAARLRTQLEAGRADAEASRELATIRRDLDLEIPLTALTRRAPDRASLRELARELEFAKLLKDFLDTPADVQSAPQARKASSEEIDRLLAERDRVAVSLVRRTSAAGSEEIAVAIGATGLQEVLTTTEIGDRLKEALAGASGPQVVVDDWKIALRAADLDDALLAKGEQVGTRICDTQLLSYVLDPSRRAHSIDSLAADRLDRVLPAVTDLEKPAEERACAVVGALLELEEPLRAELADSPLESLYRDLELPLARVLAQIENCGILVDRSVLEEAGDDFRRSAAALEAEIYELAGGPFNIGSPIQLREVLFERLALPTRGVKKGKTGLSVSAEVLTQLAEQHPIAAKVIEHRGLTKLLSTYVTGLLPMIDARTGRLHTSFNQAVAATGRLSSSEPNLQNIPVRTAEGRRIRRAFVAEPGSVLLAADYSQIELRVLAHLTQEPVLLEAFRSSEDIHRRTAAEVFAVAPEAVTSEMRQKAKVINFGVLYGMGAQRLSRELSIPYAEADQYIRRYFERYSSVRAFADRVVEDGRRDGFVTTLIGRRRYLPELHAREPNLRQAAERMAWNSPIQGTAADLIKLAMLAVDRAVRARSAPFRMLLQVHDELLFEVPQADLEPAGRLVRECMESVASLAVPLVVDLKSGPNWAALQ